MEPETDLLYDLLPEFHRNRDYYEGEPLRAYLRIFEATFRDVHASIGQLYDDWFIETCEEGAVSLIADLVNDAIHPDTLRAIPTQRGLVANAIADRQRKGTAGALQAVLRDATGWRARVVESTVLETAHLQELRLAQPRFVELRGREEGLGRAFPRHDYTVNVSDGSGAQGDIAVEVFVWRRVGRRFVHAEPFAIGQGRFLFSPLGADAPLYNHPRRMRNRYAAVAPDDVPMPIRRDALEAEVLARRTGNSPATGTLANPASVEIAVRDRNGQWLAIPPDRLWIRDLSRGWAPEHEFPTRRSVALDPQSGRFQFPSEKEPSEIRVSYSARWEPRLAPTLAFEMPSPDSRPEPGDHGLVDAIRAANASSRPERRIELRRNGRYGLGDGVVRLRRGETLFIDAPPDCRPVLVGSLRVVCRHGVADVRLRNLVIEGTIETVGNVRLSLSECAIPPRPDGPAVRVRGRKSATPVLIAESCVLGPVRWGGEATFEGCVVDGLGSPAIAGSNDAGPAPILTIRHSTVLDEVRGYALKRATGVLFRRPVTFDRIDTGRIRFSYLPFGSRVPHPTLCVHELENSVGSRPVFLSTRFGHPDYAELAPETSPAIRRGGEQGDEIGVFGLRRDRLREAELRKALADFLPFGLEARVVYEN